MRIDESTLPLAADTLRAWALDERLKQQVLATPAAAAMAARVAKRYMAGETAETAIALVESNTKRGHLGSIECVGESVRDAAVAERETLEFVRLAGLIGTSSQAPTISFDLSHLGSLVGTDTGLRGGLRLAEAAREAGTSIMISAEGSDRTDLVLNLYEQIADVYPETGVTLQARLHRTPADLERIIGRSGPIRLVKGAFLESPDVALPREADSLIDAYVALASKLVRAGHRVNIATHDVALVEQLQATLGDHLKEPHVEFEVLQGLGLDLLDRLHATGHNTREYVVYGPDWWLYVLNRLAEHPERVVQALADLRGAAD